MKLKNILSILCLMFVAVACSMDDEAVLDDIASSKNEVSLEDAYVTFSLASEGLTTKAGGSDAEVNAIAANYVIKDCSVILYKDNQILAIKDNVKVLDNQLVDSDDKPFSILTKVRRGGMKVMIIANSKSTFSGLDKMEDVNNRLQEDIEFAHDNLVKVGTADITFEAEGENAAFEPTGTTKQTETNTYIQAVIVSQLAARIDFRKFDIYFSEKTKEADVTIKSIRLLNVNNSVRTGGEEVVPEEYTSTSWDCGESGILVWDASKKGTKDDKWISLDQAGHIPVFYSFPNTNISNPVTLEVVFKVGSDIYTKTYVINPEGKGANDHNLVKSGYFYQLQVKMTITNRDVDLDVVCSVQDWIKHSISGELK